VKFRTVKFLVLVALAMFVCLAAAAAKTDKKSAPKAAATAGSSGKAAQDDSMRVAGERSFRTNCSRCHQYPPKFPPRMMGTIIRHMRVRAMITEEETHLILRYMTE
jgi:cytochrome c5